MAAASQTLRQRWARLGIPPDYARTRHMPVRREAKKLVSIGRNSTGRPIKLTPRAAGAWRRLQAAAADAGIALEPLSGFRSVARQTKNIRRKLAAGEHIEDILRFVAAPGCSEHHTGRALDLGTPEDPELEERFARTAAFRWLAKNAARFGFCLSYPRGNPHGIGYEPWHWCWQAARLRRNSPALCKLCPGGALLFAPGRNDRNWVKTPYPFPCKRLK